MAADAESVLKVKERLANLRAETERSEREQAEAKAKQKIVEDQKHQEARQAAAEADIERVTRSVTDIKTREQLLEHIRQMREEKPTEVIPVPHRTPRQMEEYNAEMEVGRAAVAKAEAQMAYNREVQRKIAEEQAAREGTMETVHRHNPSQTEQFTATGATLGKRR
jgi:chromosome segregation ATPase